MDTRLKQRLVGAVVVITLAVIFVPEWLKEPEQAAEPAVPPIEIPPRPPRTANNDGLTLSLPSAPDSDMAPAMPPPAMDPLTPSDLATARIDENLPPEPELTPPTGSEREPAAAASPSSARPPSGERSSAVSAGSATDEATPPTGSAASTTPQPPAAGASPAAPMPQQPLADAPATMTAPDLLLHGNPTPDPVQTRQPAREPAASAVDLPGVNLIGRSRGGPAAAVVDSLQTAGTSANWMVQAGSFSQQQNANELRDKLLIQGFDAFVEPSSREGRTLYRVRIGPQASRSEGESTVARLRALGFEGQIISLRN